MENTLDMNIFLAFQFGNNTGNENETLIMVICIV
jgi:hypothetical protein